MTLAIRFSKCVPHLDRADIDRAIYEVVPDLDLGVLLQNLARYAGILLRRVPRHSFIVQAL